MTPNGSAAGNAQWWFDEVPCGRSNKPGLIQKKTFDRDLETFVREVLQNSTDAGLDNGDPVRVKFALREPDRSAGFNGAFQWDEIYRHVRAGGEAQDAHGLTDYVDYIEGGGTFRVLVIEETNARGIQGNEESGDTDYAALIRDPGSSNKGGGTAGRHGLGSTLLWLVSGFQTVMFNSTLAEELPGQTSPRLVGRSFVPTHQFAERECYDNEGWFGSPTGLKRDELRRPESIWGDDAESLAREMGITRPDDPGTTIMIPGFRDPSNPTMDAQPSPDELREIFETATAEFFWPAILRGDLEVEIDMAGHESSLTSETIADCDIVRPFVKCYSEMRDAPDSFDGPGTVAKTDYPYDITSKKDEQTPTDGEVTVAARKAEPSDTQGEASERLGEIALFRGPGMIVQYKPGHYLGHSGKYHAILAAGEARTPVGEPSEPTDAAIDEFLAMAEPPMHDEWRGEKNEELKSMYESGCAGAADDLSTRILRDALSQILYSRSIGGGPTARPDRDILPRTRSRRATQGSRGGPPTPSRKSVFNWNVSDDLDEQVWVFDGTIEPNRDGVESWKVEFDIVGLYEDGAEADEVPIESVEVSAPGADGTNLSGGPTGGDDGGEITASADVGPVTFEIRSRRLPNTDARLGGVTKTRFKITDGSIRIAE